MKWLWLTLMLLPLSQSLRKDEMTSDDLSRPDGRVSYCCGGIKPEEKGSCNWINNPRRLCQTQRDLRVGTLPGKLLAASSCRSNNTVGLSKMRARAKKKSLNTREAATVFAAYLEFSFGLCE